MFDEEHLLEQREVSLDGRGRKLEVGRQPLDNDRGCGPGREQREQPSEVGFVAKDLVHEAFVAMIDFTLREWPEFDDLHTTDERVRKGAEAEQTRGSREQKRARTRIHIPPVRDGVREIREISRQAMHECALANPTRFGDRYNARIRQRRGHRSSGASGDKAAGHRTECSPFRWL